MPFLKIKNESTGTWTDVPILKGDPADTSLTDSKVKEILSEKDKLYLPVNTVTGPAPLKCPYTVNTVAKDWSITGANVGNYNNTNGTYEIPITAKGMNLFNVNEINTQARSTCTDTPYTIISNGAVSTTANDASRFINQGFPLHCKHRTSYTISYDYYNTTVPQSKSLVQILDKNGQYRVEESFTAGSVNYTINSVYNDILYILFYNIYNGTTLGVDWHTTGIFSNIRIVEGETAKPFEPYIEPVTTTIFLDSKLNGTISKASTNVDLPVLDSECTTYEVQTDTQPTSMSVSYYQNPTPIIDELRNAITALESTTE